MRQQIRYTCGMAGSDFEGFTGAVIQAAIEAAAALGGGEVVLSAGTFSLADSVHLRSGVTLRGQGSATVLLKDPMIEDTTLHYIGYGHCEIMVAHPERFRPGMGIYITEQNCGGGFLATQSTVASVDGQTLGLLDPLNCDVAGPRGGRVRTLFPLIKGAFQKRFSVCDLVLDGNRAVNGSIDGCRGGCVFLIGCSYVSLTGLECRHYDRDGISYQQCYDIAVSHCSCHDNAGNGMHPGSGTIRSSITDCHVYRNGEDGVYYCLRTQYLLLQRCLIEDNRRFGITVGHHDDYTDILDNLVRNNGWEGLFFRTDNVPYGSGRNSTVARNRFENNGYTKDELRVAEIHLMDAVEGLRLYDNTVVNPGKTPLLLEKPCRDTFIFRNGFGVSCRGDDPAGWYSPEEAPERLMDAFPITEDTLAHLRHICR